MKILDVAVKQIDDKAQTVQEAVCGNKITSFEEYKSLCGVIQGLHIARGYLLDLKDQMEHYDDND